MLHNELHRAFFNRMFVLSLLVAMAIAVAHVLLVGMPYGVSEIWGAWRSGSKGVYPPSLYNTWIGQTGYSVLTVAFYYAIPLLCCIPFTDSLAADMTTKYISQAITRSSRARFFGSKLCAAALSSGCIALVPLVANVVLTACFVPALVPEPAAGTFFVAPSTMLPDLFYSAPAAYIAFFIALTFLSCCTFGIMAIACSFFIRNRFVVVLIPFALCMAAQFATQSTLLAGFSPVNALLPYQPYPSLAWAVCLLLLLTLVASSLIIAIKGKGYEDV
ncbi:MAG: hypothetical protein FWD72_02040 [Eggerthellaceae bacterium]|nr:hypothetical protein [Eggerthellaceae bacterium]